MERPLTSGISGRPTRRDNYVPIPSEPQESNMRQGEGDSTELNGCCDSVMRLAIGRSSTSRRNDDRSAVEMGQGRLIRGRARRAGPADEMREKLYADIERLQRNISERNERNAQRRERLEALKAQDEAEKWEDELYLARTQELNDARTRIETTSTTSTEDILNKVTQLNDKISRIASEIIGAPLSGVEHPDLDIPDTIRKTLGKPFIFLFRSDREPVLEDRQLIQALLQIFLAHSCVELIDSWTFGQYRFNRAMDKLYDRIQQKETQMVARKWRQLALPQTPPGWNLKRYANIKAKQALEILACARWSGGTAQFVPPLILELMVIADELRKNVKMDVISSDIRPWVVMSNKPYQPLTMKDVAHRFGMERTVGAEQLHVLGSTEIGLKTHWKTQGPMPQSMVRIDYKTKVLCIEPLRGRLLGRKAQSDSLPPQRLSRGRSFSMS